MLLDIGRPCFLYGKWCWNLFHFYYRRTGQYVEYYKWKTQNFNLYALVGKRTSRAFAAGVRIATCRPCVSWKPKLSEVSKGMCKHLPQARRSETDPQLCYCMCVHVCSNTVRPGWNYLWYRRRRNKKEAMHSQPHARYSSSLIKISHFEFSQQCCMRNYLTNFALRGELAIYFVWELLHELPPNIIIWMISHPFGIINFMISRFAARFK